jgi:hypothetical protein
MFDHEKMSWGLVRRWTRRPLRMAKGLLVRVVAMLAKMASFLMQVREGAEHEYD